MIIKYNNYCWSTYVSIYKDVNGATCSLVFWVPFFYSSKQFFHHLFSCFHLRFHWTGTWMLSLLSIKKALHCVKFFQGIGNTDEVTESLEPSTSSYVAISWNLLYTQGIKLVHEALRRSLMPWRWNNTEHAFSCKDSEVTWKLTRNLLKKLGCSIAYLSRWRVKSQRSKAKFECGSITNALEIVDRLLKIILSESHNQ